MASPLDTLSMALFCDFENVALGVRDARYDAFDIQLVLARVLDMLAQYNASATTSQAASTLSVSA